MENIKNIRKVKFICSKCKLISMGEVKFDSKKFNKHKEKIIELRNIIIKHNQNIKKQLFIKSEKKWNLRIGSGDWIGIREDGSNYIMNFEKDAFKLEKGYNYVECFLCKHKHYFLKPDDEMLIGLVDDNNEIY